MCLLTPLVSLRVCAQMVPAAYSQSLLTSLVWRERVARILQAQPIRNIAAIDAQLDGETTKPADVVVPSLQWSFQRSQPPSPRLPWHDPMSEPASPLPDPRTSSLAYKMGGTSLDHSPAWTPTRRSLEMSLVTETSDKRRSSDTRAFREVLASGPDGDV